MHQPCPPSSPRSGHLSLSVDRPAAHSRKFSIRRALKFHFQTKRSLWLYKFLSAYAGHCSKLIGDAMLQLMHVKSLHQVRHLVPGARASSSHNSMPTRRRLLCIPYTVPSSAWPCEARAGVGDWCRALRVCTIRHLYCIPRRHGAPFLGHSSLVSTGLPFSGMHPSSLRESFSRALTGHFPTDGVIVAARCSTAGPAAQLPRRLSSLFRLILYCWAQLKPLATLYLHRNSTTFIRANQLTGKIYPRAPLASGQLAPSAQL